MAHSVSSAVLAILLAISSLQLAMASYNIVDFGAKPDGKTDAAKALLAAWGKACSADKPASVTVPKGKFFVSQALLQGPCKNKDVRIFIDGTIVADSGYGSQKQWITLKYAEGVAIYGGTLDGRGQKFWKCKTDGRSCPDGAASLTISRSTNVLVSGLKLVNSEMFHMVIIGSSGVAVRNARITAPGDSPNTDGIHVQMSSAVTITGATISTGDDCISMGVGATDVWVENINCGPGHGISIGSLGGTAGEAGVRNITVKSVVFTGTQNGLRIKTWAKPNKGFVEGVSFHHAIMNNVQNPIVVDQNYCPSKKNCPTEGSGVKISKVSYSDVRGSSATEVAVKFDCSPSNPCRGIGLKDIKLTYGKTPAKSLCKNVKGSTSGVVIPPSCL